MCEADVAPKRNVNSRSVRMQRSCLLRRNQPATAALTSDVVGLAVRRQPTSSRFDIVTILLKKASSQLL